jgi:restriction endonuclease
MMSAAVAGPTFRPTRSDTTLWDVTNRAAGLAASNTMLAVAAQVFWRDYEVFVAELIARRAPAATVVHNARLPGRSGLERQVDVLVDGSVPWLAEPQRTVVEVKAWKTPLGIRAVAALKELMDDVGAPLGLLVSPVGFTDGARRRAAQIPGLALEV